MDTNEMNGRGPSGCRQYSAFLNRECRDSLQIRVYSCSFVVHPLLVLDGCRRSLTYLVAFALVRCVGRGYCGDC